MPRGKVKEDLTGRKFGRLTVVRFLGYGSSKKTIWECICACGNILPVRANSMKSGNTSSCGCLKKPHGRTGTPEYQAWTAMLKRCYLKSNAAYENYGGRGIIVCPRWRKSFINFFTDMGTRPTTKHSLDRINNDGNYELANCRWATHSEQMINRRTTPLITYDGITLSAAEWADKIGIFRKTISRRIRSGWSVEETLTTPSRPRSKTTCLLPPSEPPHREED